MGLSEGLWTFIEVRHRIAGCLGKEAAASMPEEETNVESDEQEQAKLPKTAGRRAVSNLRSARKTLEEVDWTSDAKAQYLVAEANVLALLELADSIRSTRA